MYDIKNADILKKYGEELISFCQKRFGFKNPPNLFYVTDKDNYHKLLGKTAYYDPQRQNIAIYITGRHPKDILRSLAHELVHHKQNEDGELFSPESLGPGYAQKDSKLRNCEERAFKDGNMAFRDWEDEKKYKFKGEQIMIENNLKEAIKLIIEKKLKKMSEASSVQGIEGAPNKLDEKEEEPAQLKPPAKEEEVSENIEEEEASENIEEAKCPYCKGEAGAKKSDCTCNKELEESKIVTPEQEASFHSKLFGTRLVALNAKLMSNFIKK